MSVATAQVLSTLSGAMVAVVLSVGVLAWRDARSPNWAGPRVAGKIRALYRHYITWAWLRLFLWAALVALGPALMGSALWAALALPLGWPATVSAGTAAGFAGVLVVTALRALRLLHDNPATLSASARFDMRRLHPIWRRLTLTRLQAVETITFIMWSSMLVAGVAEVARLGGMAPASLVAAGALIPVALGWWAFRDPDPPPVRGSAGSRDRPNILMIGCDTLRADRLSALGYHRPTTPFIDSLASHGVIFANCWVPVARTAPSLATLLTGLWPWEHGIRDNFHAASEFSAADKALPRLLRRMGYTTAAVTDWAGSDLGKYDFGFEYYDGPPDQWNLRYMIRQAPKDLRLFLSLYIQNPLGRRLLPEIYYLPGVPLTRAVGRRVRRTLHALASQSHPFLLQVFLASAHPPFGSEHPWYRCFAAPDYDGPSRFTMIRSTDPEEALRAQSATRDSLDLDQVQALYDGCVRAFDAEVQQILVYLERCGLKDRTIIVIYSDHGIDLFENDVWGQGNALPGGYSNRTPLVIVDPRSNLLGVHNGTISSRDVAPALLSSLQGSFPDVASALASAAKGPVPCETGIRLTPASETCPQRSSNLNITQVLTVPDIDGGTLALHPEHAVRLFAAKDYALVLDGWMFCATDGDLSWHTPDGTPVPHHYVPPEIRQAIEEYAARSPFPTAPPSSGRRHPEIDGGIAP